MKGQDAMSVFVFFQFKLLDILGLRPELGQCVSCGAAAAPKLNLALGGAVCEACPGESVNPVWLDKIRQVYKLPSKKMNQFTVDGDRGLFQMCIRDRAKEYLQTNKVYDTEATEAAKEAAAAQVTPVEYKKGQNSVQSGEVITESQYELITRCV